MLVLRLVSLAAVGCGAVAKLGTVWALADIAMGLLALALLPGGAARAKSPLIPKPGAETASAVDSTATLRPLSSRVTAPQSSPIRSLSERVQPNPAAVIWTNCACCNCSMVAEPV